MTEDELKYGIWKSDDKGATFRKVSDDPVREAVADIIASQSAWHTYDAAGLADRILAIPEIAEALALKRNHDKMTTGEPR